MRFPDWSYYKPIGVNSSNNWIKSPLAIFKKMQLCKSQTTESQIIPENPVSPRATSPGQCSDQGDFMTPFMVRNAKVEKGHRYRIRYRHQYAMDDTTRVRFCFLRLVDGNRLIGPGSHVNQSSNYYLRWRQDSWLRMNQVRNFWAWAQNEHKPGLGGQGN